MEKSFFSSAPARVCLFGEHQDYLELKVIPSAINLRLNIHSSITNEKRIIGISTYDNQKICISPTISSLSSNKKSFQNYIEAGIIALKKNFPAIKIPNIAFRIDSKIPVASGLSSSAALLVAWINHFNGLLELGLDKMSVAELAYKAEHDILGIPCGRMDQYSSSLGGIISMECTVPPKIITLDNPSFSMIIVDSQYPKFTSNVHGKKVDQIKRICDKFQSSSGKKLIRANFDDLDRVKNNFTEKEKDILQAVLSIKKATEEAEKELNKPKPDIYNLGGLLLSQQNDLRDGIGVSLPLLDKIVEVGVSMGALGGKLTGAGMGGSVVLLTEKSDNQIVNKIKTELNLPTWLVEIEEGTNFRIQ